MLARLALVLAFYGGTYALIVPGGDYVARMTQSGWLTGAAGLLAGGVFFALFFAVERLLTASGRSDAPPENPGSETEQQRLGTIDIVALLSVAAILFLASSGYAGTSLAFGGGVLTGFLVATVASRHTFAESSLQS